MPHLHDIRDIKIIICVHNCSANILTLCLSYQVYVHKRYACACVVL